MPDTVDLKGAEVFEAGTHRGQPWTEADLDQMVSNFNALKERVKPFVKLGHDEGQGLLQKDGYPAGGWISSLRRVGTKLVADISQVPRKLAELVQAGAYKRVSSEIYTDFKDGDKSLGKVLRAIAFLGADMPQVKTLDDLRALFGEEPELVPYSEEQETETVDSFVDRERSRDAGPSDDDNHTGNSGKEEGENDMSDEYKERIKLLEKQLQQFKEESDENKDRAETLEKELAAEREAKREADATAFVESLKGEGKILPKHEAKLIALMTSLDDEEVIKYAEDGKTVSEKPTELLRRFLKGLPKLVEFKETSEADDESDAADESDDPMKSFMDQIDKVMKDREVEYSEAARIVYTENPELAKAYDDAVLQD